jgi:hypothetical protein
MSAFNQEESANGLNNREAKLEEAFQALEKITNCGVISGWGLTLFWGFTQTPIS